MDTSGERRDSPSDSSRSEAEQESDVESRVRSRSGDGRGLPRERHSDSSSTDTSGGSEGRRSEEKNVGKSSSEGDERRGTSLGESTDEDESGAVQFDRWQPQAASIRVRKPKKKVYANSKDGRKKDKKNKEDKRSSHEGPVQNSTANSADSELSKHNQQQRTISVQPSSTHYSSSGSESEGNDIDWEEEREGPSLETSTQELTQYPPNGDPSEADEGIFSRFRSYAGSIRVKLSNKDKKKLEELESEESDPEDISNVFEMIRPEDQPNILKKNTDFRRRANKAVSSVVAELVPKPVEEKKPSTLSQLCSCCKREEKKDKMEEENQPEEKRKPKPPSTQLTPQLQKASSQGTEMMKKVFFPALPHLLQDLWVVLEFGITIFAFVFGLISLDFEDGSKTFNILYFTLTIISIILAVIDAFIYFVQMGSWVECLKICYAKLKRNGSSDNEEELVFDEEPETKKCCRLSQKRKEKFNTYFELVRNIVSEAILYPLLICDLFDFIVGGVFRNVSADDHVNFTLFVVGSLYLILSVYIMRMFLIISSLISLKRLPTMPNSSGSAASNLRLISWFTFHVLCQLITHFVLILAVSLKIRNENPNFGEQDTIFISGFLWIVVVLGGLIPMTGIITFFVTNYYYAKEFSISFWIDMMSLLQAPSFTETVFESGGTEAPGELAEDFVKKSELKKVKKQYENFKSPSWYTKFFFPLRLPVLVVIGLVYTLGLVAYLVSLVLTQNNPRGTCGNVQLILFEDIPVTVVFVLCSVVLFAFNIKIIILMVVFLILLVLFIVSVSLMLTIVVPFIILFYIPIGFCVGCLQCYKSTFRDFHIFETPGKPINYYNAV